VNDLAHVLDRSHFIASPRSPVGHADRDLRDRQENFPLGAAKFPPPRVLVVDDEALLRWSLAEMLSAAGYEVVEARDGREARLAFADSTHPVAAMLLDLRLPDASGLQLLREARARSMTCPIVLMTAYGSSDTLDAALTSGAVSVLSKPFDLDDMLRLMVRLCPLSPGE
jgi:DNA-binding NtrC family response regulator